MKVINTNIEDLVVFEPEVWGDQRGYFFESYNKKTLHDQGFEFNWIQDNEAFSQKGVLRGLHYQKAPFGQTKLVRVAYGEVLDVVVDIRKKSKSYGQSFSVILSGSNKKQLLVPKGFAHGYVVLSETALFLYKVDGPYRSDQEEGIKFDDPYLGIDWILPADQLILSNKDMMNPFFEQHVPYE
jgi:dTDP-4-dehydrorhamnose 3,5-epimerase